MKRFRFFYFIISVLLLSTSSSLGQKFKSIKKYKLDYLVANKGAEKLIGIRSFANDGQQYLLLVNPQTLDSKVDLASNYVISRTPWTKILLEFKTSPYIKSLTAAAAKDFQIQDAGIDNAIPEEQGITLTIDLCPSHKPLDRIIFQSVFDEFKKIEQPAPLAISVSGKWMLKHQDDLNWLKDLVNKKDLDITWINHSYDHEVNSLPLAENFLLAPGTNLDTEVLENEKLMLKNGLTPSIFFRFPGLISDRSIAQKIEAYGLIPIGSDAWLAKGQQANNGSIVLIHGNGNEELGVKDFLELLKTKKEEVISKQWLLFDLRKGLQKAYE